MKKIIPIFGNTSSGKSFLGKNIEMKYKIQYLSFGDLKRREINSGSVLGLSLQSAISNKLPINPNDGMLLIEKEISSLSNSSIFLLSGYPISEIEYSHLNSLYEILFGINLMADETIIRKRFFTRGICPACDFPGLVDGICPIHGFKMIKREDATEEELCGRMNLFNNRIIPFIDLIKNKSLFPIKTYNSGLFKLEDVFIDINQYLNESKNDKK